MTCRHEGYKFDAQPWGVRKLNRVLHHLRDGFLPLHVSAMLVASIVLVFSATASAQDDPFQQVVGPFFKKHCLRCHGQQTQKGERQFDTLDFPIKNDDALIDFQDALDLINLGEMPPEEEPQPIAEEKLNVVKLMTAAISRYQSSRESTGGETVLRRLNRREYLNTVTDLFGLNTDHFDPTAHFPADQELHHLDNQGQELVTSGFLLHQYLHAAKNVVDKALPSGPKPRVQQWRFNGGFRQGEYLGSRLLQWQLNDRVAKYRKKLKDEGAKSTNSIVQKYKNGLYDKLPDHIRLHEHPRAERHVGSYGYISNFASGVPHDGYYEITLKAEAKYRQQQYEKNHSETRRSEPLILAIVPGDSDEGSLHLPQSREPELARFELSDDVVEEYRARVWLDRGTTPRFTFPNGTHRARPGMIATGNIELDKAGIKPKSPQEAFGYGITHSKFPQIRIHSVSIQGPFYESWPSKFQKTLQNKNDLKSFLRRAWRRPITDKDVESIAKVIESRMSKGVPHEEAFRDGIAASLCMPSFLYLDESTNQGQLSDHAIASRLSYFLWSSMPDTQLMDLADAGKLTSTQELSRQVERMLADPKSDRFVRDFLGAWLNLDALGSTPPDSRQFKEYYIDNLEWSMRQETFYYARHILDKDLSIDLFIDSDFSFVNGGLARLYELDISPPDNEFQHVTFPDALPRQRRGGLLGQPSVLTVTANGVDTSPIVRGVWILENILGTPPSPPPPDVEPLDPDIRGAKSIRDQMEKHRSNETCAECHRKIDPLGFALESFDAIGRWRSKYGRRGPAIDASGKLPGGKEFKDFDQFKKLLLSQREKFARALTKKMFAYATGRSAEISDRPEIDAIVADLKDHQWKFRYLIERIVLSSSFRKP